MSKIDWLILAEKASQANAIADAIFDKGKPNGSLINGGLGGYNISSMFQGEVRIARFQGHLYELLMPQEQDPKYSRKQEVILDDWGLPVGGGWMSAREMLSVYPIELDIYNDSFKFKPISSNHKKMAKNIKQLFERSDRIIISTDVDPEGEMIFLNWYKNEFGSYNGYNSKKLFRVNPANNDPVSIRKMFKTSLQSYSDFKGDLGDVYKSLGPRGYARAIADYEYGLTYALLGEIAQEELLDSDTNVRGAWGRLKNTILGRVYNIEKEYDEFVPSSSYRIDMKLSTGHILKGNEDLIFPSKQEASEYLNNMNLPSTSDIHIITNDKATKPPKLFSRTELLKASGKLNANVKWSEVLQSLYEHHKVLSYPRTDSVHIGEIEFKDLKKYVNTPIVKKLLNERIKQYDPSKSFTFYDRPVDRKWVDDSKITPHFAIIPNLEVSLSESLISKLSDNELNMYLVDLYQAAAILMNDSVTKYFKVISDVKDQNDIPLFVGSFKEPLEQGWRLLLGNLEKSDPPPEEGSYQVTYVLTEVPKKRPQLVDMYALVDILKKNNEGTSATRDATIDSMVKSKALVVDSKTKKLRVNPKLKPVVAYLLDNNWIQMSKTAEWQSELDNIKTQEEALRFIENVRSETYKLQEDFRKHFKIPLK